MNYDHFIFEKKDAIGIITINRPPANSWSFAALEEFEKILDVMESDADVRVIVITGAGDKCFSAGMDVSDAAKSPGIGDKGTSVWRKVDQFPKPIIAAINGHALGGGLELALSCHFRIMADAPKAKVGLTELNLGIIPGWGGTQRLYRVVGKAAALDMILFSKRIDAKQALAIGLVNQITASESLMDEALAFAGRLALRPPIAVSCVLKAISAGIYEGLDKGLDVEREGSRTVAASQDAIEGFTAFFEK
ncbi:MAG: enoyl-CoA hydratase-related protein, partial [Desulfosalsimonadaceae bacterium]|nr:enoyl-CoA hydratase-related protein [Desulfosalsimonadaceae bacterium]